MTDLDAIDHDPDDWRVRALKAETTVERLTREIERHREDAARLVACAQETQRECDRLRAFADDVLRVAADACADALRERDEARADAERLRARVRNGEAR